MQEDWRDDKYAELEAEVEIERSWRWRWLQRLVPFPRPTLRRVRSLSKALAGGSEQLLLVEGEPGAGKSVALRHLARKLAKRAARSGNPRRIIPLYINLKALNVAPDEVSADRIRQFVLDTLIEVNNRDVEEVLDEEFQRGLDEGTWLFLFDSFDEIPDVLSAPDARAIIPTYARAIADFLTFTSCRGVVASRDFSSPDTARFTRCRILRLSRKQQLTLIRRADLEQRVDRVMREGLLRASQDIATFAGNPMFLGLLCEHMRTAAEFPTNSHTVFEEYLAHRLRRDAERIRSRFGVEVGFVRAGAEEIAYTMTSTARMGLEPARAAVMAAVQCFDRLSPTALSKILDVLEYTKLGRGGTNIDGEVTFSFIHRRFQEYFATCMVIADRSRVGVTELLDVDLWRETAVTLLQVQDEDAIGPLLTEATTRLRGYVAELTAGRFHWPDGCRHVLGILGTGLESRPETVATEVRGLVNKILEMAWDHGHRLDRRRALQYVALADQQVAERLLIEAFAADNMYLRQGAFLFTGKLTGIGVPLSVQIRRTLLLQAARRLISSDHSTIRTELLRLRQPREFQSLHHFLGVATFVAVGLPALGVTVALVSVLYGPLAPELTRSGALLPLLVSASAVIASSVFLAGYNIVALLGLAAGRTYFGISPRESIRGWADVIGPAILNFVLCVASSVAVGLSWHWMPAVGVALQVLFGYAALLPPAVVWATLHDVNTRPVLLPMLPLAFLVAVLRGRFRLPVAPRVGRPDSVLMPMKRKELVEMTGALILLLPALTVLVIGVVLITAGSVVYGGAAVVVAVAGFGGPGFVDSRVLRRQADKAVTADDVLNLFVKARNNAQFAMMVSRFTTQRVTRDPEVRTAVENLVGELEQAKRGNPWEPVRLACPSLAFRSAGKRRLRDSYAFRWIYNYHARQVQEWTLDDLARLAELE